jgi:very-short-patch-repair endonuclease
VRVYRRPRLPESECAERDGIPVTTPIRTMIDIARWLDPPRLERAVNEADRLDLVDPPALLAALGAHPGERGVGPLRSLLGDRVFRLTDSELERRFLRIVHRAGLELPLTQQMVSGFRVDFHWPELGIVVETDGLRYHRTPAQQARDLRRDQAHAAAGLVPLRFSHAQVRFEAERVARTLYETSQRRRVEMALLARRRSPYGLALSSGT